MRERPATAHTAAYAFTLARVFDDESLPSRQDAHLKSDDWLHHAPSADGRLEAAGGSQQRGP
ncbi:hypothetical protein STRTUCAR8_00158 [Streptomyces turgidiscabies Car8]|uniref:Uncharacterized protein n=1 Tax=Streptomyces turgidiscabies (strain Car8) TaxID=698760 RepID=L7F259_STRT8|nr:hypothetical protein STRTUCAR8_00158 [Streptomyces turgidiscabies Car8]